VFLQLLIFVLYSGVFSLESVAFLTEVLLFEWILVCFFCCDDLRVWSLVFFP